MKNKYDKLLKAVIVIYAITSVIGFISNYQAGNTQGIAMGVVALITPWLLPLAFKIFKLKATNEIYILNIIFVYFASLIGSCFHGYSIPFFDKIVHFFSGILISLIAVMIYSWLKQEAKIQDKKDISVLYLFINNTNLAIAALWEFYEYFMLIVFNNDCINHFTTGVHDSITDMLCAFIGGLIITYVFYQYYTKKKQNYFVDLCQNFYKTNNHS